MKSYPSKLLLTLLQCFLSCVQSLVLALVMERDPSQWKLGWNVRLLAVAYCVSLPTPFIHFSLFRFLIFYYSFFAYLFGVPLPPSVQSSYTVSTYNIPLCIFLFKILLVSYLHSYSECKIYGTYETYCRES